MKLIRRTVIFAFFLLFAVTFSARAQSVSVDFGLGTATAPSNGQFIDTFDDGNFFPTPSLHGLFGTFGAGFMVNPHIGVGGEYSWRMAQGSYAGLNYRPAFYDFNAIITPISEKARVVPVFEGGIGGANIKFYYNQQFCDVFAGCTPFNTFIESSNHFQVHLAAGVRFYVKGGFFIRPQVDVHWVNNFFQFGSDWVPQYTVAIGYTLGGH